MKQRRRKKPQPARTADLTALSVGARGDAVLEGPVFAPGLLPGERARLDVRGERGRVIERLSDSVERVEPFCPVADRCGGCALQHWDREAYRAWKRGLVTDALKRVDVIAEVGDLVDASGQGRRRATFHAERAGKRVEFGFIERAGERIVDIPGCPVSVPAIQAAIPALRRLAGKLAPASDRPGRGRISLTVTASDTGLDIAVRGLPEITLDNRLDAAEFAQTENTARISLNGEPAAELRRPEIAFGTAKVSPPAGGFLQATEEGERVLAEHVLKAAEGATRIVDLYAGSGAFALRLAAFAPVTAVEGEADALAALRHAADRTPGLKPVETKHRDLAAEPLSLMELTGVDCVVIDPPRNGAKTQMERLSDSAVPVIVSVSCNPATFARDAAILIEGGYRIGPVTPVDQFAWTAHVETVAVFSRG